MGRCLRGIGHRASDRHHLTRDFQFSSNIKGPNPSQVGLAPGVRVGILASQVGAEAVAEWCARLLSGAAYEQPSVQWIGGRHAATADHLPEYWPRVWAARALLYEWTPRAEPAVLAGLRDPAWRVREMCAKVARHRALKRAEPILTHLLDDPVLRVRAAAEAALTESARSPE